MFKQIIIVIDVIKSLLQAEWSQCARHFSKHLTFNIVFNTPNTMLDIGPVISPVLKMRTLTKVEKVRPLSRVTQLVLRDWNINSKAFVPQENRYCEIPGSQETFQERLVNII